MNGVIKQTAKAILPPIVADAMRKLRREPAPSTDDPIITVTVHGVPLAMYASHGLPGMVAKAKYYDTALPRIGLFLKKRQGYLTMIDGGGGIGDTVGLVARDVDGGTYLCIEGDGRNVELARRNLRAVPNVTIEHALLTEPDPGPAEPTPLERIPLPAERGHLGGPAIFVRAPGSGRTSVATATELGVPVTTVDALVAKHPAFAEINLLKVDTDGYDYKVLRGSDRLLRTARPLVYFELSPHHLDLVGHEDPMAVFPFLLERGYRRALFYDWSGLPMAHVALNDREAIQSLVQYARLKDCFYYDVLVTHEATVEQFWTLVAGELLAFPPVRWVTV